MNIYGLKKRIERAKQMIKDLKKDKNDFKIKKIQEGINNLKYKIKLLRKKKKA